MDIFELARRLYDDGASVTITTRHSFLDLIADYPAHQGERSAEFTFWGEGRFDHGRLGSPDGRLTEDFMKVLAHIHPNPEELLK
jgi:hypothetical protein